MTALYSGTGTSQDYVRRNRNIDLDDRKGREPRSRNVCRRRLAAPPSGRTTRPRAPSPSLRPPHGDGGTDRGRFGPVDAERRVGGATPIPVAPRRSGRGCPGGYPGAFTPATRRSTLPHHSLQRPGFQIPSECSTPPPPFTPVTRRSGPAPGHWGEKDSQLNYSR